MAFTFSHAVVAPYVYRLSGHRLPLAPLTIGTMLPDLTRVAVPHPMAHHFSGMFSINLICGIVLCLLWYKLYRPLIYDYLNIEHINPPPLGTANHFYLLVLVAMLIGNFSHLVWDSFTHLDDRTWFAHHFLAQQIKILNINLYWHEFLQYFSSFLILPWLYWGFKQSIYSLPKRNTHTPLKQKKLIKIHLLIALFIASLIGIFHYLFLWMTDQFAIYWCIVQGFKWFCLIFMFYATVFCLCRSWVLKT